ncbi:MAG TPA: DsbA family protein [Xanthobacteraceae bacterium]|nr:DsbA family protein [Xanthobacteraceae bacterium]
MPPQNCIAETFRIEQEPILLATLLNTRFDRRKLLLTGGAIALVGALPSFITAAKADDTVSAADLADPGPQADIWIGSEKAPVTIVEYASMTCPHCAHFSETTYPELKKRYLDTGKARYTLRSFPLDALAAAGFMVARCAGNDKYMPVVETLFAKQVDWIVKEPIPPLMGIAKQFGMTEDAFKACLSNQKELDAIQGVRDRAVEKLGINSTPTFFVNGKKLVGDVTIDQMSKEIDPYLKEG